MLNELGDMPIGSYLDTIAFAKTHEEIAKLMGKSSHGFGSSFFNRSVSIDIKNLNSYIVYLFQSGLTLSDRGYYLEQKFTETRTRYAEYITEMLIKVGWPESALRASDILHLESQIALAHWTRAESRDRDKTYNLMTVAELEQYAPDFAWREFFAASKLDKVERYVVKQNTAFPKLAKIFRETPIEILQAWLAFRVINETAPYLSKSFADAHWEFNLKFLARNARAKGSLEACYCRVRRIHG